MFKAEHARADPRIGPSLVQTIDSIEEHGLVVLNGGCRTWRVTEVVDELFGDPEDRRRRKRVVKLEASAAICGLVLVEYPECSVGTIRVLDSTHEIEELFGTYAVASVEVLKIKPPWVLAQSGLDTYHRPDPRALLEGELLPLCSYGNYRDSTNARKFRLERPATVFPADQPCVECFRARQTRSVEAIACPQCGRELADGLFLGTGADQLEAVELSCSNGTCEFDGTVPLANS